MTIVYTLAENSFVTFASVFFCTKIKTKLFEKILKKVLTLLFLSDILTKLSHR